MIDVYREGRSVRGRMTRKQNYRTTEPQNHRRRRTEDGVSEDEGQNHRATEPQKTED